MNTRLLLPIALAPFVLLAACEPNETQTPAEAVEVDPQVDEAMEDAGNAMQDAAEAMQDAGNSMMSAANSAMAAAQQELSAAGAQLDALSSDVRDAVGTQITTAVENLEAMRDENLTDAQKAEAVANARNAAESAARTAGLSEENITEAGDAAEQAARNVLGYEGALPE